jgi:sodium-dependent dicarboxylate transporter 2/3/5
MKITSSFPAVLTGFTQPVVFFILASFGIAAAFTAVPITKRLLVSLLKTFGKNIRSLLFSMMVCTALISSVVSNVPCCAIFMAVSLTFLDMFDNADEKKNTGRAFMIAIPVASMIGGVMTPAGSSNNILALSFLEQHTGLHITFVQWMAIGIPLAVVLLPLAWLIICNVHKPAEIDAHRTEAFIRYLTLQIHLMLPANEEHREKPDSLQAITVPEIKVLVIIGVMLVLWILSSWFKGINIVVVALMGCCAFCFPGINVLEFKTFLKHINLESFFLVGTVLSLGSAMISNDVSGWLISLIPAVTLSTPLLIAFVAASTFALLLIIPVGPSLITIMSFPYITLALSMGGSPALVMITFGFCVCNSYLLPLDTVPLLTYGTGYYSIGDMVRSSLPLQICIVVIMAFWIPMMGRVLGL